MAGPEFFQTRMGQVFFEVTMPSIARSLEALAKAHTPTEPIAFEVYGPPLYGPPGSRERYAAVIRATSRVRAELTSRDGFRQVFDECIPQLREEILAALVAAAWGLASVNGNVGDRDEVLP